MRRTWWYAFGAIVGLVGLALLIAKWPSPPLLREERAVVDADQVLTAELRLALARGKREIPRCYSVRRGDPDQWLLTGYYEPVLRGARERSDVFSTPLYRVPPDLITISLSAFPLLPRTPPLPRELRGRFDETKRTILPYHSRAEIDGELRLAGRGLEIVWVDDVIETFFLHIQGSGRVVLPDGEELRVGFADRNGHPYVALGSELIKAGKLTREEATKPGIVAFLRNNPSEIATWLAKNPSYIFFEERNGGPFGSTGVQLTSYLSVAVDPEVIPYHSIVEVRYRQPREFDPTEPYVTRWLVAHDTGGAIRGGRLDLFVGGGEEAERYSGALRSPVAVRVFTPREGC